MLDCSFFFFNDTATTEIYTLSLHDALPIFLLQPLLHQPDDDVVGHQLPSVHHVFRRQPEGGPRLGLAAKKDRKSTRLNSSHGYISYAVFCLKKKKKL